MSLTNEQLMLKRIKIVSPFPFMDRYNYTLGDILTDNGVKAVLNQDDKAVFATKWEDYPLIFTILPWYEGRKPEDLPAFVKYNDGIRIVVIKAKGYETNQYKEVMAVIDKTGIDLDKLRLAAFDKLYLKNAWALPATQAEYDEFLANPTKLLPECQAAKPIPVNVQQQESEAGGKRRTAIVFAPLTTRLVRQTKVDAFQTVNLTLDEFRELMIEKSPESLWHGQYSAARPCYHITKRIMPTDEGVYLYADSAADKTPRFETWEKLYRSLQIQGLDQFIF